MISFAEYGKRAGLGLQRRFRPEAVAQSPHFQIVQCEDQTFVAFAYRDETSVSAANLSFGDAPSFELDAKLERICEDTLSKLDDFFWKCFGTGLLCVQVFRGNDGYWTKVVAATVKCVKFTPLHKIFILNIDIKKKHQNVKYLGTFTVSRSS